MMLTIKQLMNATQMHRDKLFTNATKVAVMFNSKAESGKDSRGYYLKVFGRAITQLPNKKPKKIEYRLYYKPKNYIPPMFREEGKVYKGPPKPQPFNLDTLVWVSCSCEYFMYHCEVANAEQDNSSVMYSNGKAPNITNPQHVPHLCKHLISAARKGLLLKKPKDPPVAASKKSKFIPNK